MPKIYVDDQFRLASVWRDTLWDCLPTIMQALVGPWRLFIPHQRSGRVLITATACPSFPLIATAAPGVPATSSQFTDILQDPSTETMLVSLTVGKVDAGVTVLLTPDKRLIEFPSILLPPDITSGSIVDINVSRNKTSEAAAERAFRDLQEQIFQSFGASDPQPPVLRCRNATQTSVVLEWDPIQLATANLISLALFRNGQKAGNIPKPSSMHTTKISGLAVDTEYTFHLVLRTTAGTFASQRVTVRTHKMTDLSGITITTGIMPATVREGLVAAVDRIGAKIVDGVRIDTTHFVTTEGRGVLWEKAKETNIPVVRPEWVDACERSGRILGVTKFYLDAARIGPGYEERPGTASTVAGSAPAMHQSPRQKELPPGPPAEAAANSSEKGKEPDVATPPPPPEKDEEGRIESSSSSEDEEEEEVVDERGQEPANGQEEQKSLAEEKQQTLSVRPQPTVEDGNDSEGSKDDDKKGGKKSPGGSSFQDVAL
ncbi:putative chitin biosynthesis protein CHS5 [Podospora fimiseda]|uniref:Chitin biosynthesis protein CHS5 n=1 Tax=Podospora fimiseda TaxID=252190 RepID=A0AAN7BY41_9PEZI|nr:putative chitin biosynthesis protein CHS5 [Podospora fimiseda]